MLTITIDFEIPSLGITVHPDNHFEFYNNHSRFSVTITLPQILWNAQPTPLLLKDNDAKVSSLVALGLLDDGKQQFDITPLVEVSTLPAPHFGGEDILNVTPIIATPELSNNNNNNNNDIPELISLARDSIANDRIELCPDGVGGTYFLKNEQDKIIGVFKPTDEEPGAANNPKNLLKGAPLLPPGGGAIREIAAYLLDRGHAGVPETYLLQDVKNKAFHNSNGGEPELKSGSIQRFVENIGDTTSVGSSSFSINDVHNIGILDIRLMNMDRNDENMLVTKQEDGKLKLVPIDHSYTLPDRLDGAWFDWMYWRQAKEAFSKETLEYINSIDIDADAELLRSLGIEESCIKTMMISTMLLKKAASAGLKLFDIASIICKKINNQKTELEMAVDRATNAEGLNMDELSKVVDELVQSKMTSPSK